MKGGDYNGFKRQTRPGRKETEENQKGRKEMKVIKPIINDKLSPKDRNIVGASLYEISKQRWQHIPLEEIQKALSKSNLILLQEDGTPYQGLFLGPKGEAKLEYGYARPEQVKELLSGDVSTQTLNQFFVPIKNSMLILQWYKEQGMKNYEINLYLS
jgi:hypothetical protein